MILIPRSKLIFQSHHPEIIRGGGWCNANRYCRPAYRRGHVPTSRNNILGFRVALQKRDA